MTLEPIRGLFAAVATPVRDDGAFDERSFDRLLDFLFAAGVDGICVGGATGEYPHVEWRDRVTIINRAARRLPAGRVLLVGVGGASVYTTLEIGRAAIDAGSRALLLPMPMFFRYQQDDLYSYVSRVSRTLAAPCLLYDLPDFTNGLAPETTLRLLAEEEFIVGIKDSSGRVANVSTFASARSARQWTLLVGDDRLIGTGLAAGWDGAISGVAGCCPELLVSLVRAHRAGDAAGVERLQQLLDELIAQLGVFPAPWGIRLALDARGLTTGPLPLPLSAARQEQAARFQAWFQSWRETRLGPEAT